LAGTPDDSVQVGTDLIVIAQLAAAQITAVEAASVTGRGQGGFATVAASADVAVAVDKAQYDHGAGPCLHALQAGHPVAVGDIAATTTWPAFRAAAVSRGLRASLSIPVFVGSGAVVAALNLYSRHRGSMATLGAAIGAAYDPGSSGAWNHDDLDPGGRELTAGVISALALRSMIQRAIGILMTTTAAGSAEQAYLALRARAAEAGSGLVDAAAHLIEQQQPGQDRPASVRP
jgi:hypothetical protein